MYTLHHAVHSKETAFRALVGVAPPPRPPTPRRPVRSADVPAGPEGPARGSCQGCNWHPRGLTKQPLQQLPGKDARCHCASPLAQPWLYKGLLQSGHQNWWHVRNAHFPFCFTLPGVKRLYEVVNETCQRHGYCCLMIRWWRWE